MDDLPAFLNARYDGAERQIRLQLEQPEFRTRAASLLRQRLRDIALKRAILAEHGPSRSDPTRCRVCTAIHEDRATRFRGPCWTVRQLGTEFSDHPGYREEEWAPDRPDVTSSRSC